MADYVSPEARRRIATGLMAAQYNRATPEEGNVAQRHGLLPLATYDNGRTGLAFPGFIAEPVQSFNRLLQNGYTPGDTQGVEDAFNVAGAAMMGGLAAPKPRNVVGSAGGSLVPDQAALMDRTYSRFGKQQPRDTTPDAAALDMSQAARMQRAKSMGYDTDTTWYHGTSAPNFDEFSPGKRGATFFADQPYVTDYFANTSRTDGPARVIPTYSRANKLFDPAKEADNPNLAAYVADNINQYDVKSIINPGKTHTKTPQEVLNELRNSSFGKDMFEPVEHPVIQNWIKNNGYDGFVVNDGSWMAMSADKPARIMGVFDPSKIRSTNAAFDPAKADSANLLYANGGKQGAGIGSAIGSAGGDLKGAALGAIPDTPGIRATNISDISTAGPLPNRILAYHGAASKFDNLDLARAPDVGLHYGTLDVTDQFSGFRDYGDKRGVRAPDNSRIYPVILDGSRMARAADGALFDETAQAHSFLDAVKKGKIEGVTNATPGFADLERNMSALPYGDASANPIVRDWLTSNGLDGVIYPNTYDGSGVSAMMWKNVRSALGNNDLLYANGGRGGAATGAALGAIPDTPGIRAYHGSPHDFDRFDMSKIGTGEGAQAYGHGLYFAEREGVARSYRDALGGQKLKDGTPFDDLNPAHWAADAVNRAGGDRAKAAQLIAADMTPDMKMYDGGHYQRLLRARGMLERNESVPEIGSGRMYEVNIKANPDDFLDWDKPLSQQSEKVKTSYLDALGRLGHPNPEKVMDSSFASSGGGLENLLNAWSKYDRSKASGALNEAGIPGIRYLDQGSRAGGEGSRNLVVFDDKLIEILRKYGLLGMAGGAAAAEYGGNSLIPSRPASPQYRPGDA